MSTPIQAGSTDQRLRCVAVQDDYSTFKTDLEIADIQSLVVKRAGAADVTVTENALDTDPDDAHTDGNIYNAGGGEYLVSVPDAAVASGAPSVKVYGTWTDGGDSGYLIGDEYPLVSYDWQSSERSLTTAATAAIGTAFLSTALTKGTAGTIERAFWQMLKTQAVTDGTAVADAGNTVTQFQTNLTAPDGQYDHMILVFVSNGLEGEARPIDTYVQTDGVITLQEPLTEIPTGDEEFVILPQHAHPISEIQAGLATSANQATILNRIGAFTGTGVNTILGFFKAIMFSDATEPSDAGDTFAASLEEVKSSAGSITVTPLQLSQDQRGADLNIELKLKEVRTIGPIAIVDANGSELDLSGKTLRIVIQRKSGADLQVIESASITVSGSNNNQISFDNNAAVSSIVDSPRWALWDVTNEDTDAGVEGEWLGGGWVHVSREPTKDAS